MPTLNLKVSPPQAAERNQAMAVALTELSATILGKRAEVTAVTIEGLPLKEWFIGGQPPSSATVMLVISVTAGTNTPEEKAQFIAAAFDELQRQIAPEHGLAMASYVTVRELPASDWGYGGQTQLARRINRDSAST